MKSWCFDYKGGPLMKFIHTSDWHIGKSIHEVNLLEDQKFVLNDFLNLLDIEQPDAIIIAGDLYDRAVPSKEAVNLLDEILNEIVMVKKIPILTISGNHDSGERLEFGSRILEKNGLHIEGKYKSDIQKITMEDTFGKINFYLIPFAYVPEIQSLHDEEIKSFDGAYKIILKKIQDAMNPEERNIIVTHGYIVSDTDHLEVEESVRPLSIGTTEYVDVAYFENFDYTALGHLHKPQKVRWDHVRYCGSPLKYSFSEVNHKKGVTVVELKEKGQVLIKNVPLKTSKNMIKIEGLLSDLINQKKEEIVITDYVMAVLTDENPIFDAIGRLRAVYPNILRMEYKNRNALPRDHAALDLAQKEKKSDVRMFEDFYTDMTGRLFSEEKRLVVERIFENILTDRGDDE